VSIAFIIFLETFVSGSRGNSLHSFVEAKFSDISRFPPANVILSRSDSSNEIGFHHVCSTSLACSRVAQKIRLIIDSLNSDPNRWGPNPDYFDS
jgi:hypothetical protein